MQTSLRNTNPESPIDLSRMRFNEVIAYFDCCQTALVERTDLRPETVEKILDEEFRGGFERAPRALRSEWRKRQKIWSKIHSALVKANELATELPPPEKAFYYPCLDQISAAMEEADSAVQSAAEFANLVSAPNGNPQADVVAKAVARAFEIEDKHISFGRMPDSREPSTEFGRTVQIAIEIFRPEGNDGKVADWTAPAQNAVKLVKRG